MRTTWMLPVTMTVSAALSACAPGNVSGDAGPEDQPPQCDGAEYVAFDAANHANQDLRVQAYVDMMALLDEAKADPSLASAKFTAAEDLYLNTASLADKVQGRNDDHLESPTNVGADLHATLLAGFDAGKSASTALEVSLAKQAVDKTLIEFFFLSVHHEMLLGARDKWDEAYGYFGSGPANAEADLKALASVAKKRDDGNGTQLGSTIFNGLVDGTCELARILEAEGKEEIDPREHDALWTIIEETDLAMQKVLAFSAGHEAFEMVEIQGDLAADPTNQALIDEMYVKLAELNPYFRPLERIMSDKGGDSLARAGEIRAAIDAALADDTGAWVATFDAAGVLTRLEAEYAIDVVQ